MSTATAKEPVTVDSVKPSAEVIREHIAILKELNAPAWLIEIAEKAAAAAPPRPAKPSGPQPPRATQER